jgi:hypothetical protein
MSRLTMVLAASVATAMLVVAVSALDAIGADPPAKAPDDLTARLADCLRDRGIPVPAVSGDELDHWLQTHRIPDATGRACKEAVAPRGAAEVREAPSQGAKQLSECLTAKGLDVPTDPIALKQWIGHQSSRSALDALKACGLVLKPDPNVKPAPCGAAPAKQPDAAKAPAGEATPDD